MSETSEGYQPPSFENARAFLDEHTTRRGRQTIPDEKIRLVLEECKRLGNGCLLCHLQGIVDCHECAGRGLLMQQPASEEEDLSAAWEW